MTRRDGGLAALLHDAVAGARPSEGLRDRVRACVDAPDVVAAMRSVDTLVPSRRVRLRVAASVAGVFAARAPKAVRPRWQVLSMLGAATGLVAVAGGLLAVGAFDDSTGSPPPVLRESPAPGVAQPDPTSPVVVIGAPVATEPSVATVTPGSGAPAMSSPVGEMPVSPAAMPESTTAPVVAPQEPQPAPAQPGPPQPAITQPPVPAVTRPPATAPPSTRPSGPPPPPPPTPPLVGPPDRPAVGPAICVLGGLTGGCLVDLAATTSSNADRLILFDAGGSSLATGACQAGRCQISTRLPIDGVVVSCAYTVVAVDDDSGLSSAAAQACIASVLG